MKRKNLIKKVTVLTLSITAIAGAFAVTNANANSIGHPMYRLYNPNSGEHFYTASKAEKDNLDKLGWDWENYGWIASDTGDPVYRMYNPNAGDHHYTLDESEKDYLVREGWDYEGVGWHSTTETNSDTAVLYRLYNPNAVTGTHHYTLDESEKDYLVKAGWRYEGTMT